jgi:hypothetical protein
VNSGKLTHNDAPDEGWEEAVARSMMTYGESLCLQDALDHDADCLEGLWEEYDGNCPDLTREFNEKCFRPVDR